ncbi:MAG TPA: bacitracin ABC transporter ATP-binding protein [Gammaproteobacteria bacterium]|nr:bacitracin ABC transporter ATP-binding protein [Gammaproteobacteria bacterium]
MTPILDISHIDMVFPTPKGPFTALKNVDLKISKGEFVSLIGHSGCGKSTVLNIVAGLYQATTGGVVLHGKEVKEPGPERAVVFQNHSLLPWLTAYQNVELAVKQVFGKTKTKSETKEWIEHNLKLVHMDHAMNKRPGEISGGMKQRVGIARALAMKPKVLLMDEPFGALDEKTRDLLLVEMQLIWQKTKKTILFVTHNVSEASVLGSKVVVFSNRPSSIKREMTIDYPRPRVGEDEQLVKIQQEILAELRPEVKKAKEDESP